MNMVCCDTSFLFSMYGNDVHSAKALALVKKLSTPIQISPFNVFELENALRLCEFRGIMPPGSAAERLADFDQDIAEERFIHPPCNLASVLREARRMSAQFTIQHGCRSFDVLHVAAAVHFKAVTLLTFDRRQKVLAQSEGLSVPAVH